MMRSKKMTEDEGVKAIIYLQSLVGIKESEEVARKNWRNFEDWEKESTKIVYDLFSKKEE
jgi:hypothetical protein